MQRAILLRRIVNTSVLEVKAVLRRNVFTMEGPGKGNGVPCVTVGDREQEEKILQPVAHLQQVPGLEIRARFCDAYNHWLKVSPDKFMVLKEITDMFHHSILLIDDIQDNSALRRGNPTAHSIYGVASTINAANYFILKGLKKVQSLNHPDAITVCTEQLLDYFYGQGLEICWRENYTCPSLEEYRQMVEIKNGGFMLEIATMQHLSDNKTDFSKLTRIFAHLFQVWGDYSNLCVPQFMDKKGYADDLTEGKFSFPVIHAIKSHPDDRRVMDILRQRTRDVELKKYCVKLLEDFGSLSYTRRTLEELDAEVRAEVAKHGGNPLIEDVLDDMLSWKRDTDEKNPEQ